MLIRLRQGLGKRFGKAIGPPASCCEVLEGRVLMSAGALPRPDHIVIVVEENHSYQDILGPSPFQNIPQANLIPGALQRAPYITSLAAGGASFTHAQAETHPSQGNYLALFSGSTQGVSSDATPAVRFDAPNLGGELLEAGLSFASYSESMPRVGFQGTKAGHYARRHNPAANFTDVPDSSNLPFAQFPKNFARLPTVSFVIPNVVNDMHSGSVPEADQWLKKHLRAYAKWAKAHNSLLIVTWDEGRGSANQIPTIFNGAMVQPGQYGEPITHYNILRTIEDMYGLGHAGASAAAAPITDVFSTTPITG
jgi:acid phosphatase